MIRLTLLTLFITVVGIYAFRDWYRALCGLIVLMAVIEHPDMPKTIMGIQGLNPWNILLFLVLLGWLMQRRREGLRWDMPGGITLLLLVYLLLILVGFARLLHDPSGVVAYAVVKEWEVPSSASMWSELILNTIKWAIPGLLLFYGCRSRSRLIWAIAAVLGIYFLLAIQVINWMPLSTISSGAELGERSLKILMREVGYHRVNIAVMLAGGAWAMFAVRPLAAEFRGGSLLTLAASLVITFGLALTGGRAGYATWAAVGFMLALVRWRKYLLIAPVLVAIVISCVPAVQQRMMQGFNDESRDSNARVQRTVQIQGGGADAYTITAGRNVAWPLVVDKIGASPWVGYGREAMQNMGIAQFLWVQYGEDFPHPHDAYLQWLLDNGWLGAIPVFFFYLILLRRSTSLFYASGDPVYTAVGGMCLALVSGQLVGSIGSQSFYPVEGTVGMWCSIGLMLRMYVERKRLAGAAADGKAGPFAPRPPPRAVSA